MKYSIIISAIILYSLRLSGLAESIDQTAWQILREGPEFQSETLSLESAGRSLATASNLPDPTVGGEYLWMPKDVDNRWTAELRWGVEWPGVYGARAKEADLKLSASEKAIIEQRIERFAQIKDLLLNYIACRHKLFLLEELSQNNDTIYRLAQKAADGGELTVLDLNKVRLEYANIRAAKAAILSQESDITAGLSKLYGQNALPLLQNLTYEFPEIILPSSGELEDIKRTAPAILTALAEAEAARQARKVAKMEALPSLELGYKHAFEDGMHFNGVVWGISLPLFSSRGKQKAAKAEIALAEFNAKAAELETDSEIEAVVRNLALVKQQIDEIGPIVENADYNSTLLKAYQGKVLTLIEYISDRNYFTNAAVELVDLRLTAALTQSALRKYLDLPPF